MAAAFGFCGSGYQGVSRILGIVKNQDDGRYGTAVQTRSDRHRDWHVGLWRLPFVLAVVDMENCDLILAEGFVKLVQDEIRICCEIISCVVDVAGVEADANRSGKRTPS